MPLLEKREFRPKKPLTPEISEFIKANYTKLCLEELAERLNVSVSKVQNWKGELNLTGTRAINNRKIKIERHPDYFDWSSAKKTDFIFNNK